jgi:hypothetical protein
MVIKKGQQFCLCSFDLGFTNIGPVELLVKVVDIDYEEDGIVLEPQLAPGAFSNNAFISILRWFRDEYPTIKKGTLFINNLTAFRKLVELNVADFYSETS